MNNRRKDLTNVEKVRKGNKRLKQIAGLHE